MICAAEIASFSHTAINPPRHINVILKVDINEEYKGSLISNNKICGFNVFLTKERIIKIITHAKSGIATHGIHGLMKIEILSLITPDNPQSPRAKPVKAFGRFL